MTALSQRTLLARTPFSDQPDPLVQTRELFQVCDAIDDEREIERVRAEIVVLNLGLADRIAGHYRNRGIPAEDLQQVAYVGLCKAVQRFRPSEGVTFSAFASPTQQAVTVTSAMHAARRSRTVGRRARDTLNAPRV